MSALVNLFISTFRTYILFCVLMCRNVYYSALICVNVRGKSYCYDSCQFIHLLILSMHLRPVSSGSM
jgi:hypothetical protein